MKKTTKSARRVTAVGASLALLTCSLIGCAPDPVPTPTPTPAFASEEEAYAAAEEVYRAYNEALNARANNSGTADPQQYLTGLALEGDIDAQNLLSSGGLHATGAAKVEKFVEVSTVLGTVTDVTGIVCIDVSAVSLLDDSGADVTPLDRGDMIAQRVVFVGTEDSLLISNESKAEGSTC